MSEPLLLTDEQPSRRGFLGRAVAGFVAVALEGSFIQSRKPYSVVIPIPPVQHQKTKPGPAKPVHVNHPSQLGVDMTDPAKAGQEGTVYLARWGGKELTDYAQIERQNVIPASMQKSYAALLIVDMLALPNIYGKLAAQGEPNMLGGASPLIALDDMVEIKPSAAALNTTRYKKPGEKFRLEDLLKCALQRSDNGAIEALAVHCGQKLIDAGYVKDDGAPGAAHRAFNSWGNKQAHEQYGLSPQFHMLNAHGLPAYETLVDLDSFTKWSEGQKQQPWSSKAKNKTNPVAHFGKKNAMDKLEGFEKLEVASGICTTPTANNCWGWLDGVRILAQWQMRHPDKLALFDSESGKMGGQLKIKFKSLIGKTGTSWAAGECLHVMGDCGTARIYGLAAGGKLGTRTRYTRVAQVLNMFNVQKAVIEEKPVAADMPTPQPVAAPAPVNNPVQQEPAILRPAARPGKPQTLQGVMDGIKSGKIKIRLTA